MAYRKEKIEGQLRRLISELLIKELKDPRVGFATITSVSINRDFTEARVGVSILGTPRDMRKSLEGLRSAESFIQHRVGKALGIRTMPRILFFLDSSVAEGVKMVSLLEDLEEKENMDDESLDDPGDNQ